MGIYESSKDYITGHILILWDGNKPSNLCFLDYAKKHYGIIGVIGEITEPGKFRGLENPGTAIIIPQGKPNDN